MGSINIVQQVLVAGLSKLKMSADYSDLTITCGEKEFKVHRAVICPRSDYFDAACKGEFKEAKTGKIELKDEDPKLIEHMLEYLYTLNYNDGLGIDEDGAAGAQVPAFHLEFHTSKVAVDMHATADKYSVEGLKELATEKLEKIMTSFEWGLWKAEDFLTIVDQVYEKTRSADRMREIVMKRALSDLDKIAKRDSFHDLVAKEPEFAVDMLIACSKLTTGKNCRNDSCAVTRKVRMAVDFCTGCGDGDYTLEMSEGWQYGSTNARRAQDQAGPNGDVTHW